MKFNENLKELFLGGNRIAPEDCQNIGNILRTNHTLTHLDLRDNSIQVMSILIHTYLVVISMCWGTIFFTYARENKNICTVIEWVVFTECWSPVCMCWHCRTASRPTIT